MATTADGKAGIDLQEIERRLWDSADELRANSGLKESEYSVPVLGLIFLKFADIRFAIAEAELAGQGTGRRQIGNTEYQARGVMFLPTIARYKSLLELPEGGNVGQAINDAMAAIEQENDELKGVLPRTYNALSNSTLVTLLRNVNALLGNLPGDAFGHVYEYFLGQFAMAEGRRGGQFFTPPSIVELIVQIIEPFSGRILDPACGSGGMFVHSAAFVEKHRRTVSDRQINGKWLLSKTGAKVDRETAAEVISKIDRKIKRTGDRYADEELTRDEYRAELARLRRQRDAYVAMSADEPDPKELTTLAGKWRTGDAAQRWEVLNALFERIHVRQDRKVEGYTPRMDRANRVRLLISSAFDAIYD
jgi:hypothetical protein